jgi:transcription elongation factor GreA
MKRKEADTENSGVVYMSRAAFDFLRREIEEKGQRLKEKREVAGVAFGDEWFHHDEAARDGRRELAQAEEIVGRLKRAVENACIIEPNQQTETVMIGNTIEIDFLDSGDSDEFTILGEYDSRIDKSFISHQSPLAQAVLGHQEGGVVSYESPEGGTLSVAIKKIKPGNFS